MGTSAASPSAQIDTARFTAWRAAIRRTIRAEARGDVRDTPTPVLLADLADYRADLAQPLLPPWWPIAASRAGRIRLALHERGEGV